MRYGDVRYGTARAMAGVDTHGVQAEHQAIQSKHDAILFVWKLHNIVTADGAPRPTHGTARTAPYACMAPHAWRRRHAQRRAQAWRRSSKAPSHSPRLHDKAACSPGGRVMQADVCHSSRGAAPIQKLVHWQAPDPEPQLHRSHNLMSGRG